MEGVGYRFSGVDKLVVCVFPARWFPWFCGAAEFVVPEADRHYSWLGLDDDDGILQFV
jgi:hypothetical protein